MVLAWERVLKNFSRPPDCSGEKAAMEGEGLGSNFGDRFISSILENI
jgi:hypothetical protein